MAARSKTSFPSYGRAKANFDKRVNAITDEFNNAIEDYRRVSVKGMSEAIMLIADEALRLTPVDTGALANSQYVVVSHDEKRIVGTIGYQGEEAIPEGKILRHPGDATDYSVFVHEIPPPPAPGGHAHDSPTQWKFLSTAFETEMAQAVGILTDTLRKTRR